MFWYWLFPIIFRTSIMLVFILVGWRLSKVSKELRWLFCGAIISLFINEIWSAVIYFFRDVRCGSYGLSLLGPFYNASYFITQLTCCVLMVIFLVRVTKLLSLALQGKIKSAREAERGSVVLALGIAGVFLCWPLGLAAWIVGRSDLAKVHERLAVYRDYDININNYKMTKIGMVLGIVSTCLVMIISIVALFIMLPEFAYHRYYFCLN